MLSPLAVPGPPGPVPVSVPDKQRVDSTPVHGSGQRGKSRPQGVVCSGPGVGEGRDQNPTFPDPAGVGVHHQTEPVARRGQDEQFLPLAVDLGGAVEMASFQLNVAGGVNKLETTLEGLLPARQPDGRGEALRHLNITNFIISSHHQPPPGSLSVTVTYPTDLGFQPKE